MGAFDGKKFVREKMCRPVVATAYLSREFHDDKRTRIWKMYPMEARHGWVVGVKWLQTGVRYPGSRGGYGLDGFEGDEPPSFEETAPRTLAYLVAPWPTMTPYKVPPEHVELIDPSEFSPSGWGNLSREFAVEWVQDIPRGKNGKWVKGGV